MAGIWLAHLTVYDPGLPGLRTLYFSSQGYTTGGSNLPPGGSAHIAYDPRISQPAVMRRDCFDRGTTGGESSVGYGALELVNLDGGLDFLANMGLDGQPLSLIFGTTTLGNSTPTWSTVLTGTIEQPAISWNKITLRIRDRQEELKVPVTPNTYLGNNVLPAGLEGVDDIKGKVKPKLYGRVYNISPVLVNTSKLIYQVNDGAISTVDAVYDRALGLTKGTDYPDQATMLSTAPGASTFRVWPAGGYFRLGSSPTGEITADAVQGTADANRTAAQIIKQIALDLGIAVADIDSGDVTALDLANSSVVGIYADQSSQANQALDDIANSIGAWWGFDRLGKLRMKRLDAPSGSPATYFEAADIISIDRVASNDEGRGVPTWKTSLGYKKFYTVQSSDYAGAVDITKKAELVKEYRTVTSSDATIKTRHKLAPLLEFNTLLVSSAAAQTECDRRLALYKAERATYNVKLGLDPSLLDTIDLGIVVRLTLPRFGMGSGKDFIVTGLQPDYRLKIIEVTLWG